MGDRTDRSDQQTDETTPEPRRPGVAIGAGVTSAAVVAAAAAAVAAGQIGSARGAPATVPDGALIVNGKTYPIASAPDTPLLYVLRDELGLKGPKFGCGLGQCGACSVLVGNTEARSCVTAWTSVKDEITTLEGLPGLWAKESGAAPGTLHPVQQAWIDEQVPQCGYCQNGMMIMAVHLLSRVANPTEAQVRDAFTNTPPSPHLCRCGTYQSIIAAVRRAGSSTV
jgi:aerobic-type carbon monoxide dehydrogenase small subunit (CoxS/CutS family)